MTRERAIEMIRNDMKLNGCTWSVEEAEAVKVAIEALEQPKQKTGRWIQISPAGIYECSECGKNVMTNDIEEYKWCHGCGAKMEGWI